jgi:hypothetical protein
MKMLAAGWVTGLLILGSVGCASALEPADQSNPSPPGQPEMPMIPTLDSIIDSVLEDAAKRTGIARANLKVESAIPVTWPDGSLGCPRPDVVYTQAPVPGYRVRIRADGAILDYHANAKGLLTLCPSGIMADPISRGTR